MTTKNIKAKIPAVIKYTGDGYVVIYEEYSKL